MLHEWTSYQILQSKSARLEWSSFVATFLKHGDNLYEQSGALCIPL